MKKYGIIALFAVLFLSCTDKFNGDSEEISLTDTVWTKGVFPHPFMDSFVKYNMWDPSYLELQLDSSLATTVLLRGRIKFLSGYSLWSFVVDSTKKNILTHQIIIYPDSNGLILDTIDFKYDAIGSIYNPIIIETDTGSTFLKYAVLSARHDSSVFVSSQDNGQELAAIEIKDLNDNILSGNEWSGQITVINWWATWCKPCIAEMPGLNGLVKKYSEQNVKFVAINSESKEKISKFLSNHEFNYKHFFADSTNSSIMGDSYPRNLIIDKSGNIAFDKVGGSENKANELEKVIKRLLAE